MKSTTATSLRKQLFGVLERTTHSTPTRIRYKKGDAVLMSYRHYQALRQRKKPLTARTGLHPLVDGKIVKPLNEQAEAELMRYMGL